MRDGEAINHEIVLTGDGSETIFRCDLNEHYHSTFGAVRESQFIFIENGFIPAMHKFGRQIAAGADSLNILEVGFGTGLNALLTQMETERSGVQVFYHALEAFPLGDEIWQRLNYPGFFGSFDYSSVFSKLHQVKWNENAEISHHFTLYKDHGLLEDFHPPAGYYHLVYFDAFGPATQPHLWVPEIFRELGRCLCRGGILVTFSVRGNVVRSLNAEGFSTEKLSGPPGKRHILRAVRQ